MYLCLVHDEGSLASACVRARQDVSIPSRALTHEQNHKRRIDPDAPVPMQRVATPTFCSVRLSSYSSEERRRPPLHA